MKKIFASVLIIASTFTISCSQAPTSGEVKSVLGPAIEFEVTEHDFGTIPYGGNGIYEFEFTNSGTEPLILSNVRSSCGCTVPQWPQQPINPSEKASIKVKYDTNRPGKFNKSITVYSNASETPIMLYIKGTVQDKATAAAVE